MYGVELMSSEATPKAIQTELIRINGLRDLLFARHREVLASSAPDERLLILLATLLKLRKQARACLLLAQEFMVEEILATTRTMAEVIVNAAFLQFADSEELVRFHHFDTQSLYKHSEKLRPLTSRELTVEQEAELQGFVAEARSLTQLADKAQSWSRTHPTLISRADCVEGKMADSFMPALVLTAYSWAHRAVHGTGDAIRPFYGALGSGEAPLSAERLEEIRIALSFVTFCLETYAFFLDRLLHQDRQAEILAISKQITSE
jgi:hypothetical protein